MTSNKRRVREGSLVLVSYPLEEQINNPARKYNGQQFVVKHVKHYPKYLNKRMCTLYGAVSDAGMPYWFLEEELILL